MHILYIHQYFTTPEEGGGTRSYEFARRFVKKGHKVTMITGMNFKKKIKKILIEVKIMNILREYLLYMLKLFTQTTCLLENAYIVF